MDQNGLNLVKVHGGGGYDSDFSDDESSAGASRHGDKRRHKDDLLQKPFQRGRHTKVAHKNVAAEEWDREEARNRRHHLISMNAFDRHKKFVRDYIMYYGGKMEDFNRSSAKDKTDLDVVRENHRFLWRDEDEEGMTWEKELAKKYYDKLFKEYCIADLSRYKENKFGFRWRVENEVVSGKGQFSCGNKRCEKQEGLKSWEVNFAYVEQGEKRNALVKLRGRKLNQRKDGAQTKTRRSCHLQDARSPGTRSTNIGVKSIPPPEIQMTPEGLTETGMSQMRTPRDPQRRTTGRALPPVLRRSPGKRSLMNILRTCSFDQQAMCDVCWWLEPDTGASSSSPESQQLVLKPYSFLSEFNFQLIKDLAV